MKINDLNIIAQRLGAFGKEHLGIARDIPSPPPPRWEAASPTGYARATATRQPRPTVTS